MIKRKKSKKIKTQENNKEGELQQKNVKKEEEIQ